MLLKIFKYDFIDIMKKMVLFYAIFLFIALVRGLGVHFLASTDYALIVVFPDMLFWVLFVTALLISLILCMVRYYRSMLSDEGYLTHTLPVRKPTLIISKILVTTVVYIITILVLFLGLEFYTLFELNPYLQDLISSMFQYLDANVQIVIVMAALIVLFGGIYQVSYIAMCLSLGGMFDKNKLLFAFLFYVGINFCLGLLFGTFEVALIRQFADSTLDSYAIAYIAMGIVIFIEIVGIVLSSVINGIVLHKKLNLQ